MDAYVFSSWALGITAIKEQFGLSGFMTGLVNASIMVDGVIGASSTGTRRRLRALQAVHVRHGCFVMAHIGYLVSLIMFPILAGSMGTGVFWVVACALLAGAIAVGIVKWDPTAKDVEEE